MSDPAPLQPDQWQRLDDLFHRALNTPSEQRADLVRRECRGDAALETRLLAMLQHARDEALSHPAWSHSDPPTPAPLDGTPGQRCGPYRLIEPIGQGGMGTVWRAERDDEAFDEQVAVKLLSGANLDPEAVRRFRLERQFLAELRHPHVAALLDGGTTDDGRPYLVMELIDGVRIDEYCDAQGLSVRQRIQLFRDACRAVQHAHQKLVIHRDLKPSNILVTRDGVPKLLDFGIAKVLDQSRVEEDEKTQGRPLTPRYSSPEQLEGAALSTVTDVYALGVVLYELLTLQSPYSRATTHLAALVKAICEEEVEPPSRVELPAERVPGRRDARAWRRTLAGDLDAIVLHCLGKDPARRYPSVQSLSDDLDHWLDGRPVSARRPSLLGRTGKLIRRHRVAAAAVILGSAAVLGGLGVAIHQARAAREAWREEAREHDLAELRLAQVGRLNEQLLVEKLEAQTQRQHAESRAEDIQEMATTTIFDLVMTSSGYAPTQVLRRLLDLGIGALEGLDDQESDDPDYLRRLAVSYSELGRMLGNSALHGLGRSGKALEVLEQAVEIARRAQALRPEGLETSYALARTLRELGSARWDQGSFEDALVCHREARTLCDQFDGPQHKTGFRHLSMLNYQDLGRALLELGEFEQSERAYEDSERRARALAEENPGSWSFLHDLAALCDRRAQRTAASGEFGASIRSSREGLDHLWTALRMQPGNLTLLRTSAQLRRSLVDHLRHSGELDAAAEELREARRELDQVLQTDPESVSTQLDLVHHLILRGKLEAQWGDVLDAENTLGEAMERARALLARDPQDFRALVLAVRAALTRAQAFRREGLLDEAEEDLDEVARLLDPVSMDSDATAATLWSEYFFHRGLLEKDRANEVSAPDLRRQALQAARGSLEKALQLLGEAPGAQRMKATCREAIEEILAAL